MTFSKLPEPCVTRLNTNKALHEDRIKNEGDFPSEKLISKNAPLVITSAIFVVQCSQISWKIFIICLHLIQNFKVETLSWNYLWTVDTLKLHPGKLLFFTKTNFTR